jgi:hypothetical protein
MAGAHFNVYGDWEQMKNSDAHMNDLDAALQDADANPAGRETSLNPAINEGEAARADHPLATGSLEALRLRLDAKEAQLRALQKELRLRDERIAQLERICAEYDGTLDVTPNRRLAAMGLVLESVNEPRVVHRINRITTTIGRTTDNDIALNTHSVSRYHARIVVAADSTYLIDLQSTNGCSVNGERVSRQMISDGDVIVIGDIEFGFSVGVPLSESEGRSMDETQALLDESIVFSPVPAKANAPRGQVAEGVTKAKE